MTAATAAAPARAHRPGLRAAATLIACEARMVARDTAGLVIPLGLPLLVLVTSASAAGEQEVLDGLSALELVVLPLVATIVMATIGIVNMPSFLAYYRRAGILRRLAVTPVPPFLVLLAQAVVAAAQAAIGIAIAAAVAVVGFGASPPRAPLAALAAGALVMVAMGAIGMIVAAVAPTPNSAVAIGLVLFFALGALGGMFGGRQALPPAIADLGAVLPFGAATDAIARAWAGMPADPVALASLAVTIVVGAVVATALFRWE